MKQTLIQIILICALMMGCTSAPKPQTVYVPVNPPNLPVAGNGSVWVPDQFSEYSVGRYIDPHNSSVMHDSHSLFRREQSGHWNLAPGGSTPAAASSGTGETLVLHDALTAELNRQRATSEALVGQAKILDQHLRELNAQSVEFRAALPESYRLRDQLSEVRNRLLQIERQLGTKTPDNPGNSQGIHP